MLSRLRPQPNRARAVDDLVEIGELENYVRSTCCMLLFLSKGYFRSGNCLKEIRATVNQNKPFVLVHEADPAKGGLKLEQSREECPAEIREIIFTQCEYDEDLCVRRVGSEEAMPRQVITWMRVKVSARPCPF